MFAPCYPMGEKQRFPMLFHSNYVAFCIYEQQSIHCNSTESSSTMKLIGCRVDSSRSVQKCVIQFHRRTATQNWSLKELVNLHKINCWNKCLHHLSVHKFKGIISRDLYIHDIGLHSFTWNHQAFTSMMKLWEFLCCKNNNNKSI